MYKNELEIDVFRCIKVLVIRKKFIALFTALFFLIGLGLTLDVGNDLYTSNATVYAAADKTYSESANAVNAMNAYLDVATSFKVSQRAALILGRGDIDASDIQNALKVSSSDSNTNSIAVSSNKTNAATIIIFSATASDPMLARDIADAAAESYVIEMANILKYDAVKMLDSASMGVVSYKANLNAWIVRIEASLVGFVLACIIVVVFEVFDSKAKTIREATIREQLPVIGIIPDYKE